MFLYIAAAHLYGIWLLRNGGPRTAHGPPFIPPGATATTALHLVICMECCVQEDEVDALLIQQVANSNVDRAQPLLRLGPSYVRPT